jgi:hypothetical protein
MGRRRQLALVLLCATVTIAGGAKLMDDTARLSCYEILGSLQPAKGANAPPLGTK